MNKVWNADTYAQDFSFVGEYGHDVISLIDFDDAAPQTALDLGCGTGALTQTLADKGLKVNGLDGSPEMITKAREDHPDLQFLCADACNFKLPAPVDVVFSNAVLHWISKQDQPAMLQSVYDALNPGGQFVFEMGGKGNNDLIHGILACEFANAGYDYEVPFYFPSIGEYASLLEEAGFKTTFALLFDRPTPIASEDGLAEWLAMFITIPFRNVTPDDKERILDNAVQALRPFLYKDGVWYIDYVRLRMKATKS